MEAYITPICTSLVALVSVLITNSLSTYRIKKLEEKMDKHNTLIERMYKVEAKQCEQDKEIEELKERS